jgi:CHAT domain-containing protein
MNWRLFIIFLIAAGRVPAQCPSSGEVASKITDIEGSALPNAKKIAVLRSLADGHLKCAGIKDSLYARALHRMGDLYRLDGNFDKAFEYTNEAVAINRSGHPATQPSYLTNSYYNLGIYYNLQGDFRSSMRCFDSSIYYGSEYADKHTIALMAYEQKAFLLFQRGDYQESISAAGEGIKFAKKYYDVFYEAVLIIQKAQSQLKLRDLVNAENNIKYGIEKLDDDPGEYLATAYSVYAAILKEKQDYSAAINYYNRSLELNQRVGNWPQCSRDLMDLGYLYDYYLINAKKALDRYNKAMKYAVISDDKYLQAALHTNIGLVYWRKKDYRQALSHYQHALNTLPMQFQEDDWYINPSFDQLQTITNDYYLAVLLFNKGETLLDLFRAEGNKHHLDGSLNTFLLADKVMTKMRWKQLFDESKLFWRDETKNMYEKAIEACYLSRSIEKAFYFFEKSRAVLLKDKLLKLHYDSIINIEDVRAKLLANEQTLIEFFTGDSALYALSIGKTNEFIKVPESKIKNNATRLLTICSGAALNNQQFNEYTVIARNLYKQLFEPLHISTTRIIISPDEEFIPFEALLTGEGYLLKKHAVSYIYSADLLFRQSPVHGTTKSFLGVAPIHYAKHLQQPSLIGSDRSLATISNYFNKPEILLDKSATRSSFFKSFPRHSIVQLYSHGYAGDSDPVLYFNDSIVRLSEIQRINNIQTKMIALSACGTGTGKIARGEGIFSFARGFYAAGIPSLLTTLWQVDDRSTYTITELFYKHLQDGLTKDEALRRAKLSFISQTDKLYQLPYFWSSYILIGETDKIVIDKENTPTTIYVIAAVLVLFILYLAIKRSYK